MVFFNYALRKLNAKIVYYGPGLCGKTTNLQWIHDHFEGGQRGKMISLATEGDRTIFFDLLPIDIGTIRGMDVTLQLYTVPGQVHYNSTRQLVLRGADGVVFVADSQRTMRSSNVESFENLQENLMLQGIDLKDFPHVLQFNKRDLRDLLSIEDLNESLNVFSVPIFEGIATEGIGVQETLEGIVKLVMRNLREKYEPVASASGPKAPTPMKVIGPAPVTAPPTPMPMPMPVAPPAPEPEAPDAEPPAAAAPAEPPAAETVGSFDEPTPVSEAPSEDLGDIDFGGDFPSFQDEDQIPTQVYEGTAEPEEAAGSWDEEFEVETDEPEPVFAVDREPLSEDEVEPESDDQDISGLFTDPRDEEGSLPEELPPPQSFIPAPPEKHPELDTDPSFIAESEPPIRESMDDIFAAESEDAGAAESEAPAEAEWERPAGATAESAASPGESERYVDRIEAPGPFAPPPSRTAPPPPTESTSDQSEVDSEVLRALGASEDFEALASLGLEREDLLAEPPAVRPATPQSSDGPEVDPATPPAEHPEAEPVASFEPEAFEAGSTDTVAIGSAYAEPEEPAQPPFETEEPAAEEEPPSFVEPPIPEPEPVRPPSPPAAAPAAAAADRRDRMAKSQPIMLGDGEPFLGDEPAAAEPEVVRASAAVVPAGGRSFDFTTEGNQLHLALRGSGAIAEMGQVRALDIEVPVPGQWVGNRKVTLQLRLTLTPAEEENG